MSFFPRSFYSPADPSFTPLFRLLDDFDTYSREVQDTSQSSQGGNIQRSRAIRSFSPKFDVRETENTYELHGELPGIDRDNVQIDFTEPQTLVVRGRVERSYASGTPPAGSLGGVRLNALTESGEQNKNKESHKATVEDVDENESTKNKEANGSNNNQQVTKADHSQHQSQHSEKYWVSERSVGEFSRTFSFPTRVDQDAVQANLKEGLLTVVVPKAKKRESKRITVN